MPDAARSYRLTKWRGLSTCEFGDYRVIYTITDTELVVLALRVAHRSEVYRRI